MIDINKIREELQESSKIVVSSKDDAQKVMKELIGLINRYHFASLMDLYDLVGLPSTVAESVWGWRKLDHAKIIQVSEGYLIDLPELEFIGE